MKKQDLYNFRYIQKEIARVKKRIEERRAAAEKTVAGGGNGCGCGVSDKVGNNAAELADLDKQLKQYIEKREAEESAIMSFLMGINDARLRLIVQLYFIDCKSWQAVADEIGGDETENSCKQYFKRKIEELEG